MNNGIYASFIISGTTDISEEAGLFFQLSWQMWNSEIIFRGFYNFLLNPSLTIMVGACLFVFCLLPSNLLGSNGK